MSLLSDIARALQDELGPPAGWPAVADLRIGVYLAGAALEGGSAGLAYVAPMRERPGHCCPLPEEGGPWPGSLCQRPAKELLELGRGGNPLLEAASMAVLNALCGRALRAHPRQEVLDAGGRPVEPLEILDPKPGDVVGLVGAMTPYLVRLEGRVKELHVFERDRPTVREEHRKWLRDEEAGAQILPRCSLVIVTGAALANGSLDGLLPLCRRAREVALVGPTASVLPEPLFEHGVTLLGGLEVTSPQVMLRVVSEGGSGRSLDGRCVRKRNFRCLR